MGRGDHREGVQGLSQALDRKGEGARFVKLDDDSLCPASPEGDSEAPVEGGGIVGPVGEGAEVGPEDDDFSVKHLSSG